MAAPALDVHIVHRLPGFKLDVSFQVGRELAALFGPSGAGKTLTLRAIAGLLRPLHGRILLEGQILFDSTAGIDLPPQRRRVGYVPQGYALFPHMTVAQNIAYGLHRLPKREREDMIARMVDLMGLQGLEGRRPHQLSGGQQQRVALARALVAGPRILLLDEPFSALDQALRRELGEEVARLPARLGVPVLLVTHDLSDAFHLAQRVIVMDRGRVLQAGTREEVFYHPRNRRVAQMVLMRNIWQARVVAFDGDMVVLDWQGRLLRALRPPQLILQPGQPVDVCVRPTQVMIRRPEDDFSGRPNVLCGRIVHEAMDPEGYTLTVALAEPPGPQQVYIQLHGHAYLRLGLHLRKDIEMSIRPQDLHLMLQEDPISFMSS
ncbi:MAG: ABC transporter ATP-binding protein [Dehalococcoidia bacterium]|nr:ABC transporter ATP-binding protein [Dehalococcoidia bacterium]